MALRVGFVEFVNTAPLYIPWRSAPAPEGIEVVAAPPTALNRMLGAGEIDAGLVSSYFYGLKHRELLLIPGLSISAAGPVQSVLLVSPVPWKALGERPIYLTPQSATSVMLLKLLVEGLRPVEAAGLRYRKGSWEEAVREEAPYLSIGDEALRLREEVGPWERYDLAEIWLEETGLPFVFAVWAVRKEIWEEEPGTVRTLAMELLKAKEKGLRELEAVARKAAPTVPMDPAECLSYLRGIRLSLGDAELKGMGLFFRLLVERGLLPEAPEVSFLPLESP